MKKLILFSLTLLFTILNFYGQDSNEKNNIEDSNLLNKKQVIHKNYDLDHTINIYDADFAPIYNGCERENSNNNRINCLYTNLSILANDKVIKSGVFKKNKIKKGIKKIRVILIIDETGKVLVKKVLGTWPEDIKTEIKNAIETSSLLSPAIISGKNTPVKYSFRVIFNI